MNLHKALSRPLMLASLVFLALVPVHAQFVQQGEKLTCSGSAGAPAFGSSAALSADGNTAAVGGPSDNSGTGAVWVFTRATGVWSQVGNKLVGTGAVGNAHQGSSVALSDDGNTLVVGGPDDNSGAGAIWIFTRTEGAWSQKGNKLIGTGAVGNAGQGCSVAISADGNTVMVGGAEDNSGVGALWVFTLANDVWTQQGEKLVGTDASENAMQGTSVSLSCDGSSAIVGGPGDHPYVGAAWVFTRTNCTWSQQGSKLVGTGIGYSGIANQGASVALSADGNTAIVGGPYDNMAINDAGAVWVFTRTTGTWSQQGNKLVGSGRSGRSLQGASVDLSGDGNVAIVGANADNSGTGALWVYIRTDGVWSQFGNKLVGTGGVGTGYQGAAVALSADGYTALVGGYGDNSGVGAAWVYTAAALPIQMSSFTVNVVSKNGVRLDWVTLSETNNYGFEVQRSPAMQEKYETLPNGFVPGHGTTTEEHRYTFTDNAVGAGSWSYRLNQIDLDGTKHYTEPRNVAITTGIGQNALPAEFSLGQNYPNPFNPTTTITLGIPHEAKVDLAVYNMLGQKVAQLIDAPLGAGYLKVTFDGSTLASGAYFYQLRAGKYVATRKLFLLR